VEKSVGISTSESRELESTIKSSLGGQALPSLQSEIRSKLGHEIRLEESLKEKHDFEFDSPDCGLSTHRVYQLQRKYTLNYQDNRFWLWRKKNFTRGFTEWVDNFIMPPAVVAEHDPACNCGPKPATKPLGVVAIAFNNFVIYTEYQVNDEGVVFPRLNSRFSVNGIEDLFGAYINVERQSIPPYVTTLANVRSDTLTGRVHPYRGEFETPKVHEEITERNINFSDVLVVGTGLAAVAWLFLTGKYKRQEPAKIINATASASNPGYVKRKNISIINRAPEELYQYWRDFENLPNIMKHLESVRVTGEGRSHWVAKTPVGTSVEWDAEITEDRPNEYIAWRSLEGADVDNSGSVRFEPATGNRGTIVKVEINYTPPGGALGSLVTKLFSEEPGQQAQESLRTFKQLMEVGEEVISKADLNDADTDDSVRYASAES
jgi:uncharacterized membrane protein